MAMLKQLRVSNFKAFEDFTVTFGPRAYLVGPNNAGKSTLVSALRITAAMLRLASQTRPGHRGDFKGKNYPCHLFNGERLGLVEDNIHHEFRNEDAWFEVTFDNTAKVTAVWPRSDQSDEDDEGRASFFFLTDHLGRTPMRPADVRRNFPSVGVIPVLSPLERRERELEPGYVRQNQEGRLSSRHFRNQLYRLVQAADEGVYEDLKHKTA